jgi:glycosyltransferase involved in cell wall biosynthesis
VLSTGKNSGSYVARNIGLAAASGDYVAWLDSDDYWLPDHCRIVAGLLDAHSDAVVACSAMQYVGSRQGVWVPPIPTAKPSNVFWACLRRTSVPMSTAIMRRAEAQAVGEIRFSTERKVAADFDYWLRLSRHCQFIATKTVTGHYRWHPNQVSSEPLKQLQAVYHYRRKLYESMDESGVSRERDLVADAIGFFWRQDIAAAWLRGDTERVRVLVDLAGEVPRIRHAHRWLGRGLSLLPRWLARPLKSVAKMLPRSKAKADWQRPRHIAP